MYAILLKSMNYKLDYTCLKQGAANFGTWCSYSDLADRFDQQNVP